MPPATWTKLRGERGLRLCSCWLSSEWKTGLAVARPPPPSCLACKAIERYDVHAVDEAAAWGSWLKRRSALMERDQHAKRGDHAGSRPAKLGTCNALQTASERNQREGVPV